MTTSKGDIPTLQQGQTSQYITHNEGIEQLAIFSAAFGGVIDWQINDPPVSPSDGDLYIGGSAMTGAWASFNEHDLIWRANGAWFAKTPEQGWRHVLMSVSTGGTPVIFDGAQWNIAGEFGGGQYLNLGDWDYSDQTATPPLTGEARFDNAAIASATKIYIHKTDASSVARGSLLDLALVADSTLYLEDTVDSSNYVIAKITGKTDQTTYWEVAVDPPTAVGTITNGNNFSARVFGGGSSGSSGGSGGAKQHVETITVDTTGVSEVVFSSGLSGSDLFQLEVDWDLAGTPSASYIHMFVNGNENAADYVCRQHTISGGGVVPSGVVEPRVARQELTAIESSYTKVDLSRDPVHDAIRYLANCTYTAGGGYAQFIAAGKYSMSAITSITSIKLALNVVGSEYAVGSRFSLFKLVTS